MEDEKWVKELTTADKVVIEEALEAYLNEYFGGGPSDDAPVGGATAGGGGGSVKFQVFKFNEMTVRDLYRFMDVEVDGDKEVIAART